MGYLRNVPVSTSHDLGIRAIGSSHLEQTLGFLDGRTGRSLGQGILGQPGSVFRSNTLASYISRFLEVIADCGTSRYAQKTRLSGGTGKDKGDGLAFAVAKVVATTSENCISVSDSILWCLIG